MYPLREKVTATEVLAKHVELPLITLSALRQGYIALLMNDQFYWKVVLSSTDIYMWQENKDLFNQIPYKLTIKSQPGLMVFYCIIPLSSCSLSEFNK